MGLMYIQKSITKELRRLVACRPVTGQTDQINELLDYIEDEFEKCGLFIERGSHGGFPYLVAGTVSARASKLVLQAHIDVVPAEPEQSKVKTKDGRLYGRGVYDMLFAAATYIVLMRELTKTKAAVDVGIMLTSDEEIGGFDGVGKLLESYRTEACFLPDAGSFTHLCAASKGVLQLTVTALGKSGHSSRPADYQNPITPMVRFVKKLESMYPNVNPDATTCAVTRFISGTAVNQVPHRAEVTLDIRFAPTDKVESVLKRVQQLAKMHALEVEVIAQAPPFTADLSDNAHKAFAAVYHDVLGQELGQLTEQGSSDARFFSAKNIPVVMLRPTGGELHGECEWLDPADLEPFYTILKAYVMKVATT